MTDYSQFAHDRSRPQKKDDDEEDPLEKMLEKTGCLEQHYAVQVSCC